MPPWLWMAPLHLTGRPLYLTTGVGRAASRAIASNPGLVCQCRDVKLSAVSPAPPRPASGNKLEMNIESKGKKGKRGSTVTPTRVVVRRLLDATCR